MSILGDSVFPFPQPDFLFIHEIEIKRLLKNSTDVRGLVTSTYFPVDRVLGYLTAGDPNNEDSGGTERIRYSAVAILPIEYEITESALIRCTAPSLPPTLAGTYKIETVRPTLSHTRCLLVRYKGDAWEVE